MKLYDVVFTNDKITKLDFVETSSDSNSKYKSIYIENDKTGQRYFLSRDVIRGIIKSRKDKSKETYPNIMSATKITTWDGTGHVMVNTFTDDVDVKADSEEHGPSEVVVTNYDFPGLCKGYDPRNYNIVLDKVSEDKVDDISILSIAIDTSCFQLVDYEAGGRVIQTGKRNGFQTCLIEIPTFEEGDETTLMYTIGLMVRPINDYSSIVRYNLIVSRDELYIYKFNMEYSQPMEFINYITLVNEDNKFYKSFKLSDVCGLCTEVVLVNQKHFKKTPDGDVVVPIIQGDNVVGKEMVKTIVPCTDDMINSEEINDVLNNAILSKNIRAITTVGIKLNKEFYKRYKILYMYSYSPKTGISTCVKTN